VWVDSPSVATTSDLTKVFMFLLVWDVGVVLVSHGVWVVVTSVCFRESESRRSSAISKNSS
jgi:hypothetical protein